MRVKHEAPCGVPAGHVVGGYLMRISDLTVTVPEAVAEESGTSGTSASAAQAATHVRAVRRDVIDLLLPVV